MDTDNVGNLLSTKLTVRIEDLQLISKSLLEANKITFILGSGVDNISLIAVTGELSDRICFHTNLIAKECKRSNENEVRFSMNPKYIYDMCRAFCKYTFNDDIQMYIRDANNAVLFKYFDIEEVIMPLVSNLGTRKEKENE
jgi:hypothetical protein